MQITYSALQACMWMVYCVGISFSAVYMGYKGLSNTLLGAVQSVGMILGFAVASALASIIDRRGRFTVFHGIALLLTLQVCIMGLFSLADIRGALFCVLDCVLICSVTAVIPMNISLCFELARFGLGPDFGPARAIGSLGYALLAAAMGSMVMQLGEAVIPQIGLLVAMLEAGCVAFTKWQLRGRTEISVSNDPAVKARSTPEFIRANPRFAILLLGIIIIFFSHNVSNLFLINVVTAVGGDVSTVGGINSFTAFLELPAMFFYGAISHRFKCAGILRFSLIMFVLKTLGVALAPTVGLLYLAESLQGLSFAVYAPAIVYWTITTVSPEDSAKGQALAQGVTTVGACLASVLAGIMLDAMSVRSVLIISSLVCAVGCIVCMAGIKEKKKTL